MTIKLLQLNMWAGTHFPVIKDFLSKNEFDILCFQEVSGPNSHHGNVHSNTDCFPLLQKELPLYTGELVIDGTFTSDPVHSYEGNAIFYKNDFELKDKHVLWLKKLDAPFPSDATSFEDMGRTILHLTLEKDGKQIEIVTTHLAWANTKTEQPHQRKQNLELIKYVKTLQNPWLLTGDFNILQGEASILDLEKLGRNLGKEYGIKNSIDPMHKAWERFKPGTVIDYIFVSSDVKVADFQVLDTVHMSDHLGLTATVEI